MTQVTPNREMICPKARCPNDAIFPGAPGVLGDGACNRCECFCCSWLPVSRKGHRNQMLIKFLQCCILLEVSVVRCSEVLL